MLPHESEDRNSPITDNHRYPGRSKCGVVRRTSVESKKFLKKIRQDVISYIFFHTTFSFLDENFRPATALMAPLLILRSQSTPSSDEGAVYLERGCREKEGHPPSLVSLNPLHPKITI